MVQLVARAAVLVLVATVSAAAEEESPYCKRVRALADARAALLLGPRLEVQGIKFPANGAVDTSVLAGDDYQVRAALALSAVDMYKGTRVTRVAQAECVQHEAGRVVEEVVLQAADYGRLPALRSAADYLDAQRGTWREVERRADAGVAARVVSILEARQLHDRCAELERRRSDIDGEIARLTALGAAQPAETDLATLIHAADEATMELEREASYLRTLDAWEFRITGGAAPADSSTEFFGVAHLGFNFGAFAQRAAEKRALEARDEELRLSRSELRERLRMFREVTRGNEHQASRAHQIVGERLDALRVVHGTLAHAQASRAPFARDLLGLDLISSEAEHVFLEAWLVELRRLGGEQSAG